MWTPNILYDLSGGMYLMCEPCEKAMVLICFWSVDWLLVVSGLPEAHRAPVASHLLVSSWSHVEVLNKCSLLSSISRSLILPAEMLMSSA